MDDAVGCVDGIGCVDGASVPVEPVGAESDPEVFAVCAAAIGANVVSATTSSVSALSAQPCLFLVNCLSSHRDFVTDVFQNFKSRQPVDAMSRLKMAWLSLPALVYQLAIDPKKVKSLP